MYAELDGDRKAPERELEVLGFWRKHDVFARSVAEREAQGAKEWVFYEGPPTANGKPGVHHVQARAYKDLFPRFKTMQGHWVRRRAGWDCHGLPVEIEVEKRLGFDGKADIEKYGVAPFNQKCRASVMEYEEAWRRLTERIGFWVNLDEAYMTMSRDFVESVWWSLRELWDKGLLYEGYKVVPYCAKDGTPLSSHEVGLGYKDVVDPSIFVRFPLTNGRDYGLPDRCALLVWTTTPWTLPGNVAAAVSPTLRYVVVPDENDGYLLIAEALVPKVFAETQPWPHFKAKLGTELVGLKYAAPYPLLGDGPGEGAGNYRVVTGDFVTAEDGSGIVHIAPAFGADDLAVGKEQGLPVVRPVDGSGHFHLSANDSRQAGTEFLEGLWFKDADPRVIDDLQARSLLVRRVDYEHSYPHCWRCRNPLMYYATDSWFIRNTSLKERLIEKNQEIDWHPAHIRDGRYGDWLNNLVDWALSRNRYWGTPLPIWSCESCQHQHCVGSYAELESMAWEPVDVMSPEFDPHRPQVDEILLRCPQCAQSMKRVSPVIDCWYDSGSMPFAQLHYPFENKERFETQAFPADFICEGLDQTRGWFNSLHQLGVMLFDSVAFKSVICHGLILDGEGEKMSKSRGNVIDPWEILDAEGADALRWYLYVSAPPELSRRFSISLVRETAHRFLGTLWNTYSFFALNANAVPGLDLVQARPIAERLPLERWILARLHLLITEVTQDLEAFELTPAARRMDLFVEELSNWYVRLARRRFWAEDVDAYATLWECLHVLSRLLAPFVPFAAETLYQNLHSSAGAPKLSVHLESWPQADPSLIVEQLLVGGATLQRVVSMGRAARADSGHRIRQPLPSVSVRLKDPKEIEVLERFRELLCDELNVKELKFLGSQEAFLDYELKPNLKLVGRKYGKLVPALRARLNQIDGREVAAAVALGQTFPLEVNGQVLELLPDEILVEARSPAGFAAREEGGYLVALSTELSPELIREGLARDVVRHVQELRKASGLHISDRIELCLAGEGKLFEDTMVEHQKTIAAETLAQTLTITSTVDPSCGAKLVSLKVPEVNFWVALDKVVGVEV